MKLLFCETCGDLVVPSARALDVRWCRCEAACCWWIDPAKGGFGCWSRVGQDAVSVVGIHNSLLTEPLDRCLGEQTIRGLIDATPDSYIFKDVRSLVCRFRPGFSTDTIFAFPPPAEA